MKTLLPALLWAAVAGYVVCAASAVRRDERGRSIRRIVVRIADSTARERLVTSARVERWLARSGIRTVGAPAREVDLAGLERAVGRNGFVGSVAAYVARGEELHVVVRQRQPLMRLLVDGFDSYVTADGYVFAAPERSARYAPVVTGPYRPPFPAGWEGPARDVIDRERRGLDERIADLERKKYPLYRREIAVDERLAAVRRMRTRRRWWRLESAAAFEERVERLRAEKARLRAACRYEARHIEQEIERLDEQQEALRQRQKKLEKTYEDFTKLLTFVERVENDDFWRSEVVQIEARTAPSGALEVALIPRSGRHVVLFGRLDEVERKLDKLLRFYRSGLRRVGWDAYRVLDIRFSDQVVCRK